MSNQRTGTILFYRPDRSYGFISSRPDPNGSTIDRFFFHVARITKCEVDPLQIKAGMFVRFTPSPEAPKHPQDAWYSLDVQIFKSEASAAAADLAASASTTEVQS